MIARGLSLLLCCLLLAPSALAAGRCPEKEHLPVDFADMAYTGYDGEVLQSALADLEALAGFSQRWTSCPPSPP